MIIPQWPAPKNVKALATEREFAAELGQSLAPFDSFNLADHVDDLPSDVKANRQQLVEHAQGCDQIRWLQQVHGTECTDAHLIEDQTKADASFSRQQGLACAVMTADCLPVLFCDLQGRQVAAAHAGWKGLAAGVLASTLSRFRDNGIAAYEVIAWLGPAISQAAFEVGPEVQSAFSPFNDGSSWVDDTCFSQGKNDRLHANLYGLAKRQLEYLGIVGVYGDSELCTYSSQDKNHRHRFFSYRRQAKTGRQASLIWLQK